MILGSSWCVWRLLEPPGTNVVGPLQWPWTFQPCIVLRQRDTCRLIDACGTSGGTELHCGEPRNLHADARHARRKRTKGTAWLDSAGIEFADVWVRYPNSINQIAVYQDAKLGCVFRQPPMINRAPPIVGLGREILGISTRPIPRLPISYIFAQ